MLFKPSYSISASLTAFSTNKEWMRYGFIPFNIPIFSYPMMYFISMMISFQWKFYRTSSRYFIQNYNRDFNISISLRYQRSMCFVWVIKKIFFVKISILKISILCVIRKFYNSLEFQIVKLLKWLPSCHCYNNYWY